MASPGQGCGLQAPPELEFDLLVFAGLDSSLLVLPGLDSGLLKLPGLDFVNMGWNLGFLGWNLASRAFLGWILAS